jgi:hypothetical protein
LLWELVGIELEPKPIENFKITLLSPEAVPAILFILVFYFAFRFVIEWNQCDGYRRQFLASRADFYTAHAVGLVAVSIYAFDLASTHRLSDYLGRYPLAIRLPYILIMLLSGFVLAKNTMLQCGIFQASSGKRKQYMLSLRGLRDKISFGCLCVLLIGFPLAVLLTWWYGGEIEPMVTLAAPIAFELSAVFGVVWVLFFHARYHLDKIPPRVPEGLRVS